MSSNPNNAVGTNAAYGGRTSVKAFNDNIGAYSRGILSGWACSPSSGMTVSLGGDGTTRDIAIAEDVSGNKITVNNISESPISVTMSAAPSSNSRIDLIVAYVDNPPQGSATALDNPAACGLITVNGTAAANPVAPNESAIRTAITADGASGSTAYYVILAQITIAAGTTDIVAGDISAGSAAGIGAQNIDFTTLSGNYSMSEQDTGFTWVSGKKIYKKTFAITTNATSGATTTIPHNIDNFGSLIRAEGDIFNGEAGQYWAVPYYYDSASWYTIRCSSEYIYINSGMENRSSVITIYYIKTS